MRSGGVVLLLGVLSIGLTTCDTESPAADDSCFAPNRNLDMAYTRDAVGCACRPEVDKDVCVPDSTGRLVALICKQGRWISVEDGPCWER
jgi:hypothetical protein